MARRSQGKFLGIPYNWRRPSGDDMGIGAWDPDDDRVFTPKNFGWGYTVNFAALWRRVRRRRPGARA
jgi:hypothetical protein